MIHLKSFNLLHFANNRKSCRHTQGNGSMMRQLKSSSLRMKRRWRSKNLISPNRLTPLRWKSLDWIYSFIYILYSFFQTIFWMEHAESQAIKVYRWLLFFNQSPSRILWKLRISLQPAHHKVPKALMTSLTMRRNQNRKSWGRRFLGTGPFSFKVYVYIKYIERDGLCKFIPETFVENDFMWLWVNDIDMPYSLCYNIKKYITNKKNISFKILSDVVFQLRVYHGFSIHFYSWPHF